jgi:hypothetical protein
MGQEHVLPSNVVIILDNFGFGDPAIFGGPMLDRRARMGIPAGSSFAIAGQHGGGNTRTTS